MTSHQSQGQTEAQRTILTALATIGGGMWQRIDGLRCEPKVINLTGFKFKWALRFLVWKKLVERGAYKTRSGLRAYRITDAGRASLSKTGEGA